MGKGVGRKTIIGSDGDRKESTVISDQAAVAVERGTHRFLLSGPAGRHRKIGFQSQSLAHGWDVRIGGGRDRSIMVRRIEVLSPSVLHDETKRVLDRTPRAFVVANDARKHGQPGGVAGSPARGS